MARFEILVEIKGQKKSLDVWKQEPISLNYSIADINDIASRNASYSKTIKLPETKNNRKIFGDISDLGVDATFNPNKKTKAWILVDTLVVFDGYLQLRNAYIDRLTDKVEYEVVIYADNDNFFKDIGDNFITDMDWSELDHTYSRQNIIDSWTSPWNKGYYYPLIDYGNDWDVGSIKGTNKFGRIRVSNFYPATNVKYIWDKIFSYAGYTYKSEFLNSKVFKNLYIPFNKAKLTRDTKSTLDKFSIGMLAPVNETLNGAVSYSYLNGFKDTDRTVQLGLWRIPFNNENSPYGDPNGLYNTSQHNYIEASTGICKRFVCNFDITFRWLTDYNRVKFGNNGAATSICFRRSKDPETGADVAGGVVMPIGTSTDPLMFIPSQIDTLTYLSNDRRVVGQISTDLLDGTQDFLTPLYPGEKVWVEITYGISIDDLIYQEGSGWSPTNWSGGSEQGLVFNSGNIFFDILNDIVIEDEQVSYSQVIPINFRKREFITSIIKMFNLYIEPSKDNLRQLIIEPRDDYYASGEIKDWSRKLDISQVIEEQILGETQNKKTIFKYKDDKDYYNEDYRTNKSTISYGELDYFFDNYFVNGEKKIEIFFSPTPLVQVPKTKNFVIPKIGKLNNNLFSPTEHNVRILTRFYSSTDVAWKYSDYQWNNHPTSPYNGYVVLTTLGFTNQPHPGYKIGDYVNVNQSDGGALKPALQSSFKIVEIRDNYSIVINLLFSDIGSGPAVAGLVTPLEGLLPCQDGDYWFFTKAYGTGQNYITYPYLGHFDNPFNPNYDLNYGQTTGLYFIQDKSTFDNLYSVYWQKQIAELNGLDSRLVTAQLYLTAADIEDFRFNDNIFIKDQYYRVNRISGFDPTQERTTEVQLIKTKYISIPRNFTTIDSKTDAGRGNTVGTSANDTGVKITTTDTLSSSGNSTLGGSVVVGKDNTTSGGGSIIAGGGNTVASDGVIVVGKDNTVGTGSDNVRILGDGNTVGSNTDNVLIVGNGQTVTTSDTVLINGILIVSPDLIDAGRDVVLNPFSAKIPNLVDASRDEVRQLGSMDIVSLVQGGRYTLR